MSGEKFLVPAHPVNLADVRSEKHPKIKLSSITGRGPKALWRSYLYRSTYSQFSGHPGLAKSTIGCDLVARASRGQPFPETDNVAHPPLQCVIFASEDSKETFAERLRMAGADESYVDIITTVPPVSEFRHILSGVGFAFAETLDMHVPAGTKGSNDNPEIRRQLQPMLEALAIHETALLGARHWNKNKGQDTITRASGAMAFTAASRASLSVMAGSNGGMFLCTEKVNLGPKRPPLRYTVTTKNDIVGIVWQGYDVNARPSLTPAVASAVAFLEKFLADGPQPSKLVKQTAMDQAIPYNLLHDAKVHLQIQHTPRQGFRGITKWFLPISDSPIPTVDLSTLGEEPGEWDSGE